MSEGEGNKVSSVDTFISPGIGVAKTWQGILEISLRVAAVVSCKKGDCIFIIS